MLGINRTTLYNKLKEVEEGRLKEARRDCVRLPVLFGVFLVHG